MAVHPHEPSGRPHSESKSPRTHVSLLIVGFVVVLGLLLLFLLLQFFLG